MLYQVVAYFVTGAMDNTVDVTIVSRVIAQILIQHFQLQILPLGAEGCLQIPAVLGGQSRIGLGGFDRLQVAEQVQQTQLVGHLAEQQVMHQLTAVFSMLETDDQSTDIVEEGIGDGIAGTDKAVTVDTVETVAVFYTDDGKVHGAFTGINQQIGLLCIETVFQTVIVKIAEKGCV